MVSGVAIASVNVDCPSDTFSRKGGGLITVGGIGGSNLFEGASGEILWRKR